MVTGIIDAFASHSAWAIRALSNSTGATSEFDAPASDVHHHWFAVFPGVARLPSYILAVANGCEGNWQMIYVLAVFVPPLALLLNGQPFSALLNLVIIVPCVIFGLVFHVLWLVPAVHAIIAISMKREDRRHREIVDAIERRGPPPGWR
jgi:hypothetical protein